MTIERVPEALGEAVRRLEDIEAIKMLKSRYCRYVDQHRWDEFRELFSADAQLDIVGIGTFNGADAFVEFVTEGMSPTSSTHHVHAPEIEILGPDFATGIWQSFGYMIREAEAPSAGHQAYGYYEEEYVK